MVYSRDFLNTHNLKKKHLHFSKKCSRHKLLEHFFENGDVYILNYGYLNSLKNSQFLYNFCYCIV